MNKEKKTLIKSLKKDAAKQQTEEASECSLRPVREDDARLLFKWKNSPDIRRTSITQDKVSLEDHMAWLKERLKDPHTVFHVIEVAGCPAGQVRFDMRGKKAIVSIGIDKAYRSRGLGMAALKLAVCEVFEKYPVRIVEAQIRQENTASLAFFAKAGFKFKRSQVIEGAACSLYEMRK